MMAINLNDDDVARESSHNVRLNDASNESERGIAIRAITKAADASAASRNQNGFFESSLSRSLYEFL